MDQWIKILTVALLVAGSGGILWSLHLWFGAFRSRRRLRARFLSETYEIRSEPDIEVHLQFEVTNLGDKQTALSPFVSFRALSAISRSPITVDMAVQEQSRTLNPHSPAVFTAHTITNADYSFSWYRRYTIPISRGRKAVIRHLNAHRTEIGFFRYWTGYITFRFFGYVPGDA